MDISRLLTGRKERRYDRRKVNEALGPWRPFDGPASACIPGTRLPRTISWTEKKFFFFRMQAQIDIGIGIVTHWLRFEPRLLRFIAYFLRDVEKYKRSEIPRTGKTPRVIEEPMPLLKFIQRRILRRILDQTDLPDCAHGFLRDHSILTCAQPHVGKEVVVCCDLRDFFPTIKANRVWGVFRSLIVNPRASNLLAALTTFQGRLPQGAPTSPMIANLVVRRLDRRLNGVAKAHGITYTRYADDLVFSGGQDTPKILRFVRKCVEEEGFALAEEKTRILRRGRRQEVCGVVVNDRPGVPRPWRRRLRAEVHRMASGGAIQPGQIAHVRGELAFLQTFHPQEAEKLRNKLLAGLKDKTKK